jgi:uncharacterized protein involved in exopolysaccharide biosynthesis
MDFNSTNLVVLMYKWRKQLIIIPAIGGVLAIIFSMPYFIKPLFESAVVVFPSTTNSVSKALMPQQNGYSDEDILEFGDEQQAEQLLQILNSDEIRNKIIKKYDLLHHYNIPEDAKYKNTSLIKAYSSNISFRRTEFMSVEIKVLDTDPDTAALIANDIAGLLNEVKRRIKAERAQRGLEIVEGEYKRIQQEIGLKDELITNLRYKGVHDYESQAAVISEQLSIAQVSNPNSNGAKTLQAKLDTLAKYGGLYVSLRDELRLLKEEEIRIKIKYSQAMVDVNSDLPATFEVNRAYPAERKTYPKRSLIVIMAVFSTFILTLVTKLILNTIKNSTVED